MAHKARPGKLPRRATDTDGLLRNQERCDDISFPGIHGSVGESHAKGMAFGRVSGAEGARVGLFALLDDSTLLEVSLAIPSMQGRA
jgi:hypothetical protein